MLLGGKQRGAQTRYRHSQGIDPSRLSRRWDVYLRGLLDELPMAIETPIAAATRSAVYVDTVEEKCNLTRRPKPAFRPHFEIAARADPLDYRWLGGGFAQQPVGRRI